MAYAGLFDGRAPAAPLDDHSIAELLRCSLGLSAWKQYRQTRWALRVNPSSGNLHPTEGYIVRDGRVCHYAPAAHALEQRAVLPAAVWQAFAGGRDGFLVALTSIHWREAWKYGERAFRYCQHDIGHAIGALRFAAALLGWRMTLLPRWSDQQLAALLGLDRAADFADAESEDAECVAVITAGETEPWRAADPAVLATASHEAVWTGTANRLSPAHAEWPIVDDVAAAVRYHGARAATPQTSPLQVAAPARTPSAGGPPARTVILQRRSALAFDARTTLPRRTFQSMLARLDPRSPPFDAIDWPPHVHLLVFVHRVDGLTPGLYAFLRDPAVLAEWRAAMRPEFLWEPVTNEPNEANGPKALFLLVPTDVTWVANRLSCDQDIAGDGFFSLGMIARLESSVRSRGEWFYRRLFWECGLIGQVLYLEAEAAGARSTGIGCFYDDPVHEMAGLSGREWQSLYHFSMGMPVEDTRLTTDPGYPWEIEPR